MTCYGLLERTCAEHIIYAMPRLVNKSFQVVSGERIENERLEYLDSRNIFPSVTYRLVALTYIGLFLFL